MSGIFINYRVGKTGTVAHLLYQRLAEVFDSTQIYFASENNIPGRPFDTAILDAIRTCDVLLTVIGPDWHTVTERSTGTRRLWDHEDWVRREIVEALARGIPVIPVLIDGANLPDADELPEDLRDLRRMHYARLGHRSDDPDVADLIAAIRRVAPGLATPGAPDEHPPDKGSPGITVQNNSNTNIAARNARVGVQAQNVSGGIRLGPDLGTGPANFSVTRHRAPRPRKLRLALGWARGVLSDLASLAASVTAVLSATRSAA